MEARRAVDAVAIEQRQRRVAEIGRAIDERLRERRALEKAEGGRGVKLDVKTKRFRFNVNGQGSHLNFNLTSNFHPLKARTSQAPERC